MPPSDRPVVAVGSPLDAPDFEGGSPVYCSGEEALNLICLNSAAGVTVELRARFLSPEAGRVNMIRQTLVPNTNRTAKNIVIPLAAGWLLDWSVIVTAGTPLVGQCYAILQLQRGLAASALELSTLGFGYITTNQRLYGSDGSYRGALEDEGAALSIQVGTPAAGSDWLQTVPAGARWELISIFAALVAANAGVARAARLAIDDGVNPLMEVPASATQAINTTGTYCWSAGAGGPITADVGFFYAPIANDLWLRAGWRIRSSTGAINAADQWGSISLLVREWLEP